MHHDDECTLPTQEVYEKLKESVYGKSLYCRDFSNALETVGTLSTS